MQQIMLGNMAVQNKQHNNGGGNLKSGQGQAVPRHNNMPQGGATSVNVQPRVKHINNAGRNTAKSSAADYNKNTQQAVNQCAKKRKRHGNYTIHYILFVLFCLAAFAVLSSTVLFNTQNIYVDGSDKYAYEQIVEKSGIKMGDNLVRMKTDDIRDKLIGNFPYIKEVNVKRVLPSTVKIEIVQAVPATALEIGEKYAIADIDGKLLETDLDARPDGLYLLRGINSENINLGQALPDESHEQFVMFGYLKDAIEATGFDKIDWIDVSNRLNMRIMYDNRIVIELGSESQLDYKLSFVKNVIENNLEPNAEGIIDTARIKEKEIRFRNEDVHKNSVQAINPQVK